MTKQEAIRRLYGLIADINAEEVADHIKDGVNLCDWTNLWRCEAKDVLRVLEDTTDTPQMERGKEEKGQWVPCDERMPNEDGYYLVTLEFDYGREIEMGWLLDGEWINENSHVTVAWMPLPEVWKDDGER